MVVIIGAVYVQIYAVHTHTHYKFTHKESHTQYLYLNPSRLPAVIGGESMILVMSVNVCGIHRP